jgi:hypothetical protein
VGLWIRRSTVIAYCLLIFFLSSQKIPQEIPGFPGMDLVIHFFEYGLLAFLLCWMLSKENSSFIQMSFRDLLADALGATSVVLMLDFRDYEP